MKKVHCPICDRSMTGSGPKEWPDWPFCSPRCKLIDLGRWLGGEYRIEAPARADDEQGPALSDSVKSAVPSAVPDRDEA
jgi:endogenous inhibitor of DNA gyrase (YacG/DUF329 family)